MGFEQILSNTYHLGLRPGSDLIERMGGLHHFMGWKGSILTDSGGYQVMSLSKTRKIDDDGVRFKSHLDGSELYLTPERSIEIQGELGVDISMCLDQCPPYPCTRDEAADAMRRTHLWAPRNLSAAREGQSLFGIVQGGVHEDLRRESPERGEEHRLDEAERGQRRACEDDVARPRVVAEPDDRQEHPRR